MSSAFSASAIVTCYNLEWSIGRAIESVLFHVEHGPVRQVVVVDDGSSDRSREIISSYAERHSCILPVFKENGGAGSARNTAIRAADFDLLAFLDGDDLWTTEKFEIQSKWIAQLPEAGLYVGDYRIHLPDSEVVLRTETPDFQTSNSRHETLRQLFLSGGVLPSATIARKQVLEAAGCFDESLRNLEDEDMWLRVADKHSIQRTPGIVLEKFEHAGNLSSNVLACVQSVDDMTKAYLEIEPGLERYSAKREQRVRMMRGKALISVGERGRARQEFLRAWLAAPHALKPMIFMTAASLFENPDAALTNLKVLLGKAT